jgi:hypothetical protein
MNTGNTGIELMPENKEKLQFGGAKIYSYLMASFN